MTGREGTGAEVGPGLLLGFGKLPAGGLRPGMLQAFWPGASGGACLATPQPWGCSSGRVLSLAPFPLPGSFDPPRWENFLGPQVTAQEARPVGGVPRGNSRVSSPLLQGVGWSWAWPDDRPQGAGSGSTQHRRLQLCLWPEMLGTRPTSLAGSSRPGQCWEPSGCDVE